jgi:hypothetical protein
MSLCFFSGEVFMPQGKAVFLGLNQTGLIVAILMFFLCTPFLCWIPWLIDSCRGNPE